LAKWLGATQDPELLIAAIQNNQSIRIDAALANDKLSLITIGVGFDAEVVRRVHQGRAGHITKWSYAWPIWRAFWSYRFPELTVTAETGQTPAVSPSPPLAPQNEAASQPLTTIWKVRWLFVANLPKYAGGLSLSPSADPHDGRLDLAMFQRGGRVRGLLYAAWLALRRPLACRDFMAAQATEILVESTETVGFQVDGDFGGQLPLRIQLLPGRIRLLRF
jgi:diacylglycerol kinase family enzyme